MTHPSDDAVPPVGGAPDGGPTDAGDDRSRAIGTPDQGLDEAGHGRHVADEDPGAGHAPARSVQGTDELVAALDVLRGELTAQRLPLVTPGVEEDRRTLALAVDQLDDYLLPRLRSRSAPLLVVVGGSTGAGKSTLVNSVLGERATVPGVLRPTTRSPVLVHHPLDARWFSTDRILPGLARVTGPADHGSAEGAQRSVRLVASEVLPPGLALLDAPDVDSVVVENRELAAQLLGAADLWLFVTTAARYADAVPWDLLHEAATRRAQVALVLDRVDPGAEAVGADLQRLASENGLGDAPIFVVPEASLVDGLLPETAVGEISRWLTALGGDAGARSAVIDATRDGVVDDLVRRALRLAGAVDVQHEADDHLRSSVDAAYDDARRTVLAATSDGAMLRGEVLARWQDFVGTGEFFRAVEQKVGSVRDAIGGFFRGKGRQVPGVEEAISHGLESVVLDAAEEAAERTYRAWRADPAGAALLDGLDLSRASASLRTRVAEEIRGWQSDVLALVGEQAAGRRGTARALSFGLNGLGVALMILVFASTGGITGAEIGIAGGTAVLAQKLLEAVFGDDAVRRLTRTAQDRLADRVAAVLDGEARRYTSQLDALGTGDATGAPLRAAAYDVRQAARREQKKRDRAGVTGEVSGAVGQGGALRGARAVPASAPPDHTAAPVTERPGFWRRLFGTRPVEPGEAAPTGDER
ncbi:dynamin family protein [Oerskovia sp. USHLN155]|uniref:dynamin family protein n=1 Tax=Oerskovia sp. USHLN155 TaxID=3081288 RepID=UPI0030188B87